MKRATKIRIYPTVEQAEFLNAQFGAVRFAYNKALSIKNHYYRKKGKSLSPTKDIKPLLAIAKKSRKYAWLKQYDSIALQQSIINLNKAFDNFFNSNLKANKPCFKSKHERQSSYHCTSIKVGENCIKIPKLKPIKARLHRDLIGKVSSITISRTQTGKHFASILCDDGINEINQIQVIDANKVLGLDLGLTHFAIDSQGNKEANPRFLKRAANNLRRKQKALSRKKKGSKSRNKARLLVAKCHEKTANSRSDFQHKLSRNIIDENQAIIVETLKVKNMLKNRKLAKHISDVSWSDFVIKLEYKAKEQSKHVVKISQWFASSKTCHCCDHKVDEMKLDVRNWVCPLCNTEHDRDINAAINIKERGIVDLKAAGLTVSANGGPCKSSQVLAAA